MAIIRYHASWPSSGDPYYQYNPSESTTRIYYYPPHTDGNYYTPYLWIDGTIRGGFNSGGWQSQIQAELAVASPLQIDITGTYNSVSRQGTAHIRIIATEPVSQTNLRLRLALTQSNIYWHAPNNSNWHNQTFRDMMPSTSGRSLTISEDDTLEFDQSFSCPSQLNYANCELVAFVQSDNDRSILQGAKIDVLDLEYVLSAFDLISPPEDTTLFTCSPYFIWHPSEDVDSGYPVSYEVYCDVNPNFSSPLIFDPTSDTTLQIIPCLQYGIPYYWKVLASNGHAPDRFSEQAYSFTCIATGAISGEITEIDGTTPIEGALIEALIDDVTIQSCLSGPDGAYLFEHLPVDTYDLRVSRDGYLPQTTEGILVELDLTEIENFELPPVFAYLTGDANMFNEIVDPGNQLTGPWRVGGDVTFLVNYLDITSGNQPCLLHNPEATTNLQYFYASADATGDCLVLGGDVSRLVQFFGGNPTATINWCGHDKPDPEHYYPPLWENNRGSGFPKEVPPLGELPAGWPNCQIEPRPTSEHGATGQPAAP